MFLHIIFVSMMIAGSRSSEKHAENSNGMYSVFFLIFLLIANVLNFIVVVVIVFVGAVVLV